MFGSSSRPKARRITRSLSCAAVAAVALVALSSSSAMAASTCEGQTFSQPFQGLGDLNYYTLVEGSQFNGPEEGWELSGGAQIVQATRPDGSAGGVLEMPAGSQAVSAPVCVTAQYPTARVYVDNPTTSGPLNVAVAYANSKTATKPKGVASVRSQNGSWAASEAFGIRPPLGLEGTTEVRFVFTAPAKGTSVELYGVYVDPRMI